MESLIIKGSDIEPEINFNADTGILTIKGLSLMEDPFIFYQSAIDWIKKYIETPKEKTVFNFRLLYINSASMVNISRILRLLSNLHSKGYNVLIRWYYDEKDTTGLDVATELEELYKLPFELIPLKR